MERKAFRRLMTSRITGVLGTNISVTDNYDSFETDGSAESLLIPLKNLINSFYSRDISRKISTAVHTKQLAAEHIPSAIPYGYRKSTTQAYRFEPDPETRDVVTRIFKMRLDGMEFSAIARKLNEEGIPSPGHLRWMRGVSKDPKYEYAKWNCPCIKQICMNPTYTGDLVFGRMPTALYLGQPDYHYEYDESKWRVLKDKASFRAMCDFAMQQDEVKVMAANERLLEAANDFADAGDDDWKKRLQRNKNGVLNNNLHNIRLIMENDSYMKNIVFNQLADGMEIRGSVPWKHPARFWRDADDAQLICYIDASYGSFSQRNYDIAVTKAADDRSYHPIKEYFDGLPVWDEIPRVDTVLIDYLGAQDNSYVRAVTRKALCAAYMRIYHPGIKFDYITVLNGNQGIGKSTLIAILRLFQ